MFIYNLEIFMDTVNSRLSYAIQESGIQTSEIVAKLKTNKVTAGKWRRGETITISALNLYNLAKITNCDLLWLITGKGEPFPSKNALDVQTSHVNSTLKIFSLYKFIVPTNFIRNNKMTFLQKFQDVADIGFLEEFFKNKRIEKEDCIIALVESDNMEPEIKKNDLVLVNLKDPMPQNNKLLIVCFSQIKEIRIVRSFLRANGDIVLKSDNPNYIEETITNDDIKANDVIILGSIVTTIRNYL